MTQELADGKRETGNEVVAFPVSRFPFPVSHLRAFIFDLDGVLWRGSEPIAGAAESVMRLRAAGRRCFYCTNNSRRRPADFANTLRAMGIELQDDEVMTSSTATALYLSSQFPAPFTAYVVGEAGLRDALRGVGAHIITDETDANNGVVETHDSAAVDCVVTGIDRVFNYDKLRRAQGFILGGAQFVATNRDATFPVPREVEPHGVVPGAGSIVAAIETASGVAPTTIGKPQPAMAHLLMEKFGLKPDETAMVGDRLDTDIVSARRSGIGALFVATGVNSTEQARRATGEELPDALFDDLPALCRAVLS